MIADRVVVGIDFSHGMMRAGSWLRSHIAPGSELLLVHAVECGHVPFYLRAMVPTWQSHEQELRAATEHLEAWRHQAGLEDATVIVRAGRPDRVLRDVAEELDAELIVIGARSGTDRPWLRVGSTVERLLRSARSSILVVHGAPILPPRVILVAVDDAEITPRVLSVAGTLGDRLDARLHAVHVVSNAAYSHAASMSAIEAKSDRDKTARIEADVAAEALRWLTALWHTTTSHGKIEIDIPHGTPGAEILTAADRIGADLIVIGSYGAGRSVPAVLGSVLGSVVHGAQCPVLVVGGPGDRGSTVP